MLRNTIYQVLCPLYCHKNEYIKALWHKILFSDTLLLIQEVQYAWPLCSNNRDRRLISSLSWNYFLYKGFGISENIFWHPFHQKDFNFIAIKGYKVWYSDHMSWWDCIQICGLFVVYHYPGQWVTQPYLTIDRLFGGIIRLGMPTNRLIWLDYKVHCKRIIWLWVHQTTLLA